MPLLNSFIPSAGGGGIAEHGNEYHNPDFAEISHTHSDLSPAHKDAVSGVHSLNKSCRLWNSNAQSIPNASPTALTFNTEKWNTDDMHNIVSNTHLLTCKTAGKYMVVGAVEFAANGTGNRQIYIYRNDTILEIYNIEWAPAPSNSQLLVIFCAIDLAVNDTIQLKVYQNSGGALNSLVNDPYTPQLAAFRIA